MTSTALCAIVKNEGEYIAEWLAHHVALGFDRVLIFDNDSTDNTRAELQRLERLALIEVRSWPDAGRRRVQVAAYEQACRELAGKVEWVAFLDVDEFLVSQHGDRLPDLLSVAQGCAGIAVNWLMFGTSGHEQKPDGLVLEAFQMRSAVEFPPNRHVKSLIRPDRALSCSNAHAFVLDGAYCGPAGQPVRWEVLGITAGLPNVENWRVHHYFTRHRAFWHAKIARRRLNRDEPPRTAADIAAHNRNDVYDAAALRYVPAVRAMLDRIAG